MGGTIRTDGDGVLETNLVNFWEGRKVAWACFNGDCLKNRSEPTELTPIEECNDDADGDGDRDLLSTVTVICGGELATATVTGCPPLDNPPSTVVELGLAGFPESESDLAAAELPTDRREGGVLHLTASLQRNVGTRSLCAVSVPFGPGDSDEEVLARARDAIAASPTCAANGVQAVLDAGHAGPSEDEFARSPRLLLQAPGLSGSQLVTAIHTDPGRNAGACMRLGEIGVPVLNRLQVMKISLQTPPEGAAGGSVRLVEHTPLGTCALTVPTVAGQSGAQIAAAVDAAVHAPGIPGPHPDCPADRNPRDIVSVMGFLLAVQASSLELCSNDPRVGFDLRTKDLMNAHPVADAGDDRVLPGNPVSLDGSLSADSDSTPGTHDDVMSFEWFDVTSGAPVALGTGETLNVPLAAGLHRLRLRVTDRGGLADTDEILVSLGTGGAGGGGGIAGKLLGSFHVGSVHPLGDFSDEADANVHVRADLGYGITNRLRLLLFGGLSQLTAETASGTEHPRLINASANAQVLFPLSAGRALYLQGGPGIYWPKSGSSDLGFNLGLGVQLPIPSSQFRLELGADYHRVSKDEQFLTLQLGVLF